VLAFIRRNLDPAARLGEILFGLIMALGITGAVRLGREEADNHALFVGIFGCNLAWAVVDGVMYVLTALFERARKARLARDVLGASTEDAALRQIGRELDGPLMAVTTPEDRLQLHRSVLAVLRRGKLGAPGVHRADLLGGVAVALLIVLATFPIIVPYLVVPDPNVAVRVSNAASDRLACGSGAAARRWRPGCHSRRPPPAPPSRLRHRRAPSARPPPATHSSVGSCTQSRSNSGRYGAAPQRQRHG